MAGRTTVILVRHGQSEANAAGRLAGRVDSPLTALGERQAAAAGRLLAAERAAAVAAGRERPLRIVASPLTRARATAEAIAAALGEVEVEIEPRLIELDYGELDGVALAEVPAEEWAAWRADTSWRPPGGETLGEVQERVTRWCEELAASQTAEVIAVSHVSPIKAAAAWALGHGPELSWRLSLGVATMTRLTLSPPALVSFGEGGHLTDLG